MSRLPYASDGEYILYPLSEEDKEYYAKLYYGDKAFFFDETGKDAEWDLIKNHSATNIYSIYNISGDFCGNIEINESKNEMPEIGIKIVECKRNQGIARIAVKMLVQKYCKENEIEYFLIKIRSTNFHSRHIFEKMGAVIIGEEDSFFKSLKNKLMEYADENQDNDYKEFIEKHCKDDEVRVLRYKLLPDVFKR